MKRISYLLLALLSICPSLQAQVGVPNKAVTMLFPDTQASFFIKNKGNRAVIVQLNLADRINVYQEDKDGLALLYPSVVRLEPDATQKVSVTWRGDQARSHYYYVRVNTVSEKTISRDRANPDESEGVPVKVGQAFPLNIINPAARPILKLQRDGNKIWLYNAGKGGDYVDALRLMDGRIASIKQILVPDQRMLLEGINPRSRISAIKLRRFGWISIEKE